MAIAGARLPFPLPSRVALLERTVSMCHPPYAEQVTLTRPDEAQRHAIAKITSVRTGPAHAQRLRLPEGHGLLLFHGDVSSPRPAELLLVGPCTYVTTHPAADAHEFVALRLQPGMLHALAGRPAHELADRKLEATALLGSWLRDRLMDAPGPLERHALLEGLVTARLRTLSGRDLVCVAACDLIERSGGRLSGKELGRATGYSARHLRDLFLQHLGLPPKVFARIVRFRAVLAALGTEPRPSWAALAIQHGYCDQSHLINAFIGFTGRTPQAFLADPHLVGALAWDGAVRPAAKPLPLTRG
ncbi:MAG: AraC family transcriptional regulator [Planctomycetes bacterium]|nr:AraC family transcriptional regulator [Planctomycetota bacterium]